MLRRYSFLDKIIAEVDAFVGVMRKEQHASITSPAKEIQENELTSNEQKHVSGLMRVDHTGEVCAQALYRGQAMVAKDVQTQMHLYHAAEEEQDHLAWCQERLDQLDASPSLLNPLWYLGSFAIGATAGLISDKISYGFVVETEKQVMNHLDHHLKTLPPHDKRSQAILQQMYMDELKHANEAKIAGGVDLPLPIRLIMKVQSKVMTTIAYRI